MLLGDLEGAWWFIAQVSHGALSLDAWHSMTLPEAHRHYYQAKKIADAQAEAAAEANR